MYDSQIIGETGVVDNINQNSQTFFFEHNYTNPVIFIQPLSYNGPQTAIVRIEEISTDSFTAFVQEPNSYDGFHANESFSYLVLEEGTWQLDNNTLLEVGSSRTDVLSNKGWEDISFTQNFGDDPLIFSQVQTDNDRDFVLTRHRNIRNNGFQLALQKEEFLTRSSHGEENIGWFAISERSGDWGQSQFISGSTDNSTSHRWQRINFDTNFSQPPVFLASIGNFNGSDPAGLRSRNLRSDRVDIRIQEDKSRDKETRHTNEAVDFFAIARDTILHGFSPTAYENEAPIISSANNINLIGNEAQVIDISATDDLDLEGNGLTYSISGGEDQSLFSVSKEYGVLTLETNSSPGSSQYSNIDDYYKVQVTVTDSSGLTAIQDFNITISPLEPFEEVDNTPEEVIDTQEEIIDNTPEEVVVNIEEEVIDTQEEVFVSSNTERINTGVYSSPAWTGETFEGSFSREVTGDGENLDITLDADSGGFDAGIARVNNLVRVDEIPSSTQVYSEVNIELDGSGDWWVGPKVSVRKESTYQGLDGNYENYIVDNSSISAREFHERFTTPNSQYIGETGVYLGETKHDGSTYRHYYIEYENWSQYWAIRQDYRPSGSVSIKPVLDKWRNNGLPNDYIDEAKINVETNGNLKGNVQISDTLISSW